VLDVLSDDEVEALFHALTPITLAVITGGDLPDVTPMTLRPRRTARRQRAFGLTNMGRSGGGRPGAAELEAYHALAQCAATGDQRQQVGVSLQNAPDLLHRPTRRRRTASES
jgi:hypothetical protein